MKKKWYQSNWFIILLLILLFPVGIFLMYKYADWDIKVKIVITAIIVFFVFSTYNTDVEPPELILKEDTYIVERENKIDEKTLKNDIIKSVSDNQTNLTNSDVQVIDFDKIDFMKKGTYQVQLKVTDGNDNITEETLIVKVKANKADLKAEKEAEEKAKKEAEEKAKKEAEEKAKKEAEEKAKKEAEEKAKKEAEEKAKKEAEEKAKKEAEEKAKKEAEEKAEKEAEEQAAREAEEQAAREAEEQAAREAEEQAAREAEEQAARQQQVQTPVNQVPESSNPQPYYQNCTDVKYHGAAPIYRGQPGWQDKFDRDGDGVACEV